MTDNSPTFKVDYYGSSAILATSSQLYKQLSLNSFEKVFFLQPVFRKELKKNLDYNHLTEFWQLDIEMIGTMDSVMLLIEELFLSTIKYLNKECSCELHIINRDLPKLCTRFPKIEYTSCNAVNKEDDLKSLSIAVSTPTWILNWPIKEKPEWYYKTLPTEETLTQTMDLVYPQGFGEGVSGGQRETNLREIIRKMKNANIDSTKYSLYLETFKENFPDHAGCGLGIERFIQWLCNLRDITDTIPFPRRGKITDI